MIFSRLRTLCLLGPALCSGLQAAILIHGFTPELNDRFANDASFIADDYDLSGIGMTNNSGAGRWVTMISPSVFLSAHHFAPSIGDTVTFHASNDPLGPKVTRTVIDTNRIGASDVRAGTLDAPLPAGYAYYEMAKESAFSHNNYRHAPENRFVNTPYYGAEAFIFGRSPSTFSVDIDMAVGRNRLEYWIDQVTAGGTTDAALLGYVQEPGDHLFSESEAFLQPYDSGAPVMVPDELGRLTIVGLNWFISTTTGGSDINGFSYLGNHATAVEDYKNLAAATVPEVNQLPLLLGALALGAVYRFR